MNALYICLGLPVILFAIARVVLPNVRYEFDFSTNQISFTVLLVYIERIANRIFWFGMVGAFAFQHFIGGWGVPVILLGAGIYALLFNMWVLLCYESYLHIRYPRDNSAGTSNYTLNKYSVTLALAASSIILAVLGAMAAMRAM